jgi:catechol 2,3-dioxygenase-like lactoylglutathione lyase family enzyme
MYDMTGGPAQMQSMFERQGMKLPRLQHASLAYQPGEQEKVRAFYSGLLGLQEKQVPEPLANRGLIWFFAGDNAMEIHLAPSEYLQRPGEGRHLCFEVPDIEELRRSFSEAGYEIISDIPIPQRPRFFVHDPFGNYLEFTTILEDYLA